jgi:alcohol dehydrogenase class IV
MHALAHPLGALYGVHHGLLNAVLMPYVIAANDPAIEADGAYLARCLGVGSSTRDVLNWVLALRQEVGIAHTLSEVGAPSNEIERVAQMAVEDPSAGTNPIPFTAADYAAIFRRALAGDLPAAA